MLEASWVWLFDRVSVERSPPSPSESQFAPTASRMISASDAIFTAYCLSTEMEYQI
jgi:hypothetical protein